MPPTADQLLGDHYSLLWSSNRDQYEGNKCLPESRSEVLDQNMWKMKKKKKTVYINVKKLGSWQKNGVSANEKLWPFTLCESFLKIAFIN